MIVIARRASIDREGDDGGAFTVSASYAPSEAFWGADDSVRPRLIPPTSIVTQAPPNQPPIDPMPRKKGAAAAAAAVPMDAGAAAAAAPAVPNVDAGAESTQLQQATPDVFAAYKPKLADLGISARPHPSPTVESGLLATVPLPNMRGYTVDGLPAPAVADGRLSDLQIESVLYAGQRHCLLVPSSATASTTSASTSASASAAAPEAGQPAEPEPPPPPQSTQMVRGGFFLGDGTGVGKGRQLAAMVLDNIARGRKKHLWVSTSIDLANEAAKGTYTHCGAIGPGAPRTPFRHQTYTNNPITDFTDVGAPGVVVRDQNQYVACFDTIASLP